MKKLLFVFGICLLTTVAFAQDYPEHPGKMDNVKVDTYVDKAFELLRTKIQLGEELGKLEEDVKAAGLASTSQDDAKALKDRANKLELAYGELGLELEKATGMAEDASKATVDCGIKAVKCTKAVKTATKTITIMTTGIADEVKRAAAVKSKVEALETVTE